MLKVLVELLHSLVELPTVSAKFRREEQLPVLLHALLCVRGLVMQKTAVTAECEKRLQPLLGPAGKARPARGLRQRGRARASSSWLEN